MAKVSVQCAYEDCKKPFFLDIGEKTTFPFDITCPGCKRKNHVERNNTDLKVTAKEGLSIQIPKDPPVIIAHHSGNPVEK